MAKCTNVTYLMKKKDGDATFEKLLDITEYPDLGGEKEKLDVTTLSDKKKRTINGIEDTGDLNFKAWYAQFIIALYSSLGWELSLPFTPVPNSMYLQYPPALMIPTPSASSR